MSEPIQSAIDIQQYQDGGSVSNDIYRMKANISVLEGHLFDNYKRQNELKRALGRINQDTIMLRSAKNKMQSFLSGVAKKKEEISQINAGNDKLRKQYEEQEERNHTLEVILKHLKSLQLKRNAEINKLDQQMEYNRTFFKKVFEGIEFWDDQKLLDENLEILKDKVCALAESASGDLKAIAALKRVIDDLSVQYGKEVLPLKKELMEKTERENDLRMKNKKDRETYAVIKDKLSRSDRTVAQLRKRTDYFDISLENKDSQSTVLPDDMNPRLPLSQDLHKAFKSLIAETSVHPGREKIMKEVAELEFFYVNALKAKKVVSEHFKIA